MCAMTERKFRWHKDISVLMSDATWYAYERAPGELRYSRQKDEAFGPLYAIRVKPKKVERIAA